MMNPTLRCPLPPFSTTVDTIRQWNMTGKTPVMRVIPLPTQQGAGGGVSSSITNVTNQGGGGSANTPTSVTLLPLTAFFNVPFLPPQGTYTVTIKLSQSFQPLQLSATQPVEVRIYSNPTTQIQDIARPTDIAVPFNLIEGVITDVVFDTVLEWDWENRIGANADSPQTVNAYITVVNPSLTAGVAPCSVTLVYVPLES